MTIDRTQGPHRSLGRARALATVLLLAGGTVACSADASDPADRAAPPEAGSDAAAADREERSVEVLEQTIVPLADDLRAARYPVWSADGEAIVLSALHPDGATVEIFRMPADGGQATCLTCGIERSDQQPYLKPIAFSDGERILIRIGEQSPVTNGTHAVIECEPSVSSCDAATLVPIEVPHADDAAVVQPQREFRIAPDGQTVGFTQVRTDAEGGERFTSIVGRLRRAEDRYVIDDPRAITSLGELKNFTPDGSAALISGFTTLPDRAADPDVIRIDLASGEQEDVTDNGDYDEDLAFAPDGESYAVFSARTSGLFETVSQVRRPNAIGPGIECLFGYLFANHRKELLEPWVVAAGAEQEGELGQLLNPGSLEDGWDARTLVGWHPDGTRLLFWEDRGDPFDAPTADGTRFVIVDLVDREPSPAPDLAPVSPAPTWAPALGGHVPAAPPEVRSRAGEVSGTLTVQRTPGERPGSGTVEVTFDGFSDDGEWVVDGTESARYDGGLTGGCDYRADLAVSGDHEGYLRADASIEPGSIDGTIESEVDGRSLALPVP